jgi:hypothetical protein
MARRKHHLSVRFDGRTGSALHRAAGLDDRTVSQQIQRYVRRGLTEDGYWDSQAPSDGACSEPLPPSSDEDPSAN